MKEQITRAMILSAGFGTRVKPLSLVRPKALFPVLNRPLISLTLDRFKESGIEKTVINSHHLAPVLETYLAGLGTGLEIHPVREKEILGTGGGVKNAAAHFDNGPFLVMNGDVVTDIDIRAVTTDFFRRRPIATLALHDVPGLNNVAVDASGRIRGFRGCWPDGEKEGLRFLAFTGLHVVSPELPPHIPAGYSDMVDVYQGLLEDGALVAAHVVEDCYWLNLDGLDLYRRLHRELLARRPDGPVIIDPEARIEKGARVEGWAAVGPGAVVESGATVRNSVLWPDSRVISGADIRDCIVADGAVADRMSEGIAILPDRDLCDTPALKNHVASATGAV